MIRRTPNSRSRAPWRLLLGLLCLALVVFGSTVQVAHSHPAGDISHADCSLCATAHIVAHVVKSPVPVAATAVVSAVHSFVPLSGSARHSVFALFTRPPPAVSTLA